MVTGDPRWYKMWKTGVTPNDAVHAVIDPPEFEVDLELEAHVDADVLEARGLI